MSDTVTLSRQKLDIDEAARAIQAKIAELQSDHDMLMAGIKAIDKGLNMLDGSGILAGEIQKIMKNLKYKL